MSFLQAFEQCLGRNIEVEVALQNQGFGKFQIMLNKIKLV